MLLLALALSLNADAATQEVRDQVTHRVFPEIPTELDSLNSFRQRCEARVHVDQSGLPYKLDVRDCSPAYADAAEAALWEWRFKPMIVDGDAYRYHYDVGVTFVREGGQSSAQIGGEVLFISPHAMRGDLPLFTARDVKWRRRPADVSFPAALRAEMLSVADRAGPVQTVCRAYTRYDGDGRVAEVEVQGCHPDTAANIERSVARSRLRDAPAGGAWVYSEYRFVIR